MLIPYVIETTNRGERGMDIFSRLLRDRIIFLGTPVDDNVANIIIAQMLLLSSEDGDADIGLYINSPGGSVHSGLAIYDAMQYIKNDVATYCMGLSASIAALVLAGGASGKRFSLQNSRMLIHQPWTQASRPLQASDLEIEAREILRTRNQVNSIIAQHTGQDLAKIERDSERDFWMDPTEAKEYGLIDDVLPSAIKTPETDGVASR